MRKKSRTRSAIEKDLDRAFSIFIRLRDSNENGIARCISCGKADIWTAMDCGHYISRVHRSTRWNPLNCHTQCKRCNIFMHGNYPAYALALVRKFGSDILTELEIEKNKTFKLTTAEMTALLEHYRELNKIIL